MGQRTDTPDTPAKRDLAPMVREAVLLPETFNEAAGTVDVTWTTGARIRRYDWYTETAYEEELEVSPDAVDMSRFEAGAVQVLDGHRQYGGVASILGIVQRGWIEGAEGRATIKLSQRQELAGIVADIKAGIIRCISVGYAVQRYEITRAIDRSDGVNMPLYRAVRWVPSEISFVPVPADMHSGTRSQPQQGGLPCEFIVRSAQPIPGAPMDDDKTPKPDVAAQRAAAEAAANAATVAAVQRAADITELCTRHNVPKMAADLIRGGKSLADAGLAILEERAKADAHSGGHLNATKVETRGDEQETQLRGLEEALLHRVDPKAPLTDNGRQYRGMSLLEMGREYLESRGVSTRGMERMTLAQKILHHRSGGMHTTSDFGSILANVGNKRLRMGYEENPGTYKRWARRAPNLPDFKSMSVTQISAMPDLLKVNEHGEFKYGSMSDGATSYALLTYGRIVSLSRQAIVNDDLRAFDRALSAFGGSAMRLENRTAYAQITGNPTMQDGVALFHATHANLGTGGGSALQLSALAAMRTAMRLQKGLQAEELNVTPAGIIVPAALEQTAYQLTSSSYVPATQAAISEFQAGGRTALDPVVEPILDAVSATAWYGFASNGQVDTVEYAYLDGAEGPVMESEMGFEVDGMQLKCRLDFAAKVIDFRGLYKANGA